MADFWLLGSSPEFMDALQISFRTGARTSDARFTSQVGAGSKEQCFAGVRDSNRATSSRLTTSKLDSDEETDRVVITGDGALAVEARILSTLDVKKAAKSSAEK